MSGLSVLHFVPRYDSDKSTTHNATQIWDTPLDGFSTPLMYNAHKSLCDKATPLTKNKSVFSIMFSRFTAFVLNFLINLQPFKSLLHNLSDPLNHHRTCLVWQALQYCQFPLAFIYGFNADIMVFFLFTFESKGKHLVLPNINSLQYNYASPNPSSLPMYILSYY